MFYGVFESKSRKIKENQIKIGVGLAENAAPALFLCSKTVKINPTMREQKRRISSDAAGLKYHYQRSAENILTGRSFCGTIKLSDETGGPKCEFMGTF